jgi:outer membrane lipoprotein
MRYGHFLATAASTLLLALLLGACAAPVFHNVQRAVAIAAIDVQANGDAYAGTEILWGGRIVRVENLERTTEVEVVSYPLDRDRQPRTEDPTQGRFLLILPGFAEPFDYQAGRHLTVHGVLAGTRSGRVQEHEYLYPVVEPRVVHVWPWGFMFDRRPRISIGIGARIR